MASDAGLRLAKVARFYRDRPSALMTRSLSEYEAYCVDEALAVRLDQDERAANVEPVRGPSLAGGMYVPGPVL